jgi:hypothetical protein
MDPNNTNVIDTSIGPIYNLSDVQKTYKGHKNDQ